MFPIYNLNGSDMHMHCATVTLQDVAHESSFMRVPPSWQAVNASTLFQSIAPLERHADLSVIVVIDQVLVHFLG